MTGGDVSAAESIAADWVARQDRGPLDLAEQRELDEWLAADDRHFGAYARAQAVWHLLERGRALACPETRERENAPEVPRAAVHSRRALVAGVVFAGAASIFGDTSLLYPSPARAERLATTSGEIRSLQLSDGSRTTLNDRTILSLRFDSNERFVSLEQGEGWFHVAKDSARPFIVRAGLVEARAVGTAFSVVRRPRSLAVTVDEGIVAVLVLRKMVKLVAGERAQISAQGEMTISRMTAEQIQQQLAWRNGWISLQGETMGSAIAIFNRFNDVKIVLADPRLASEPVIGWFSLYDSEQFAEAASSSLGAVLERRSHQIILSPRRSPSI